MGSIVRARLVWLVLGALAAGVAVGSPAHADVLLLTNGDLIRGQLDITQLPVATSGGVVQVSTTDLNHVVLGTIGGVDVVRYKNGTALTGLINRPAYTMRLASGQTTVIESWRVKTIQFGPR